MIKIIFKILIIDTDHQVLSTVAASLRSEGYIVLTADDTIRAIQLAKEELPHLVITEVLMPKLDGIEVCKEIKQLPELSSTQFIFHTHASEEYSQVAAFEAGADDYVIKPMRPRVLARRIKALLARHTVSTTLNDTIPTEGLFIDRESYMVYADGDKIKFPRLEFELLALLAASPQRVFTRNELAELLWGYKMMKENRTIDVHIRKIREKLGDRFLKTIRGVGYKIDLL